MPFWTGQQHGFPFHVVDHGGKKMKLLLARGRNCGSLWSSHGSKLVVLAMDMCVCVSMKIFVQLARQSINLPLHSWCCGIWTPEWWHLSAHVSFILSLITIGRWAPLVLKWVSTHYFSKHISSALNLFPLIQWRKCCSTTNLINAMLVEVMTVACMCAGTEVVVVMFIKQIQKIKITKTVRTVHDMKVIKVNEHHE